MPPWKETAQEWFADDDLDMESCDTPYELWFKLFLLFEAAYATDPRDEDLIGRIYDFADWCDRAPRGQSAEDDLLSCVCVSFYEDIAMCPPARDDMPRWFRYADVRDSAKLFGYHLTKFEFEAVLKHMKKNHFRYRAWRGKLPHT